MLRDLATLVEDEMVARQLATSDQLTGLANRRGFFDFASKSLALCKRLAIPATVFMVQIDGFEAIGEQHGPRVCDDVERDMAAIIAMTFRTSDAVARLSRNTFCVFASKVNENGCSVPLARLAANAAAYNQQSKRPFSLAYRVGTMIYDPTKHTSLRELVAAARGRLVIMHDMTSRQ
ncbi:MAG TPA: GGDEF domain-containing protein [Sorangium sp.]|nr:GGDEF domain-containing protein [Sorangium sp.]